MLVSQPILESKLSPCCVSRKEKYLRRDAGLPNSGVRQSSCRQTHIGQYPSLCREVARQPVPTVFNFTALRLHRRTAGHPDFLGADMLLFLSREFLSPFPGIFQTILFYRGPLPSPPTPSRSATRRQAGRRQNPSSVPADL